MALNQPLFKQVHDVIAVKPDEFRMADWENSQTICGTTRCLAGWAIHLTTGAPLYNSHGEHSPEVLALAREVGAKVEESDGVEYTDFEDLGGILLGLEPGQRGIFYSGDQTATRFIAAAAEGDDEMALGILRDRHK